MNRSAINQAILAAKTLLQDLHWSLPAWADWSPQDYAAHPDLRDWLHAHQMGWDVTDFGAEDFARRGLTLFCLRNGRQSDPDSLPYAEKLLFIGENQETPFHMHRHKREDIINRGGGDLMMTFRHSDGGQTPITLRCDGVLQHIAADTPLCLKPGTSVSIPCGVYHSFYARPGSGMVLGGEVSQVNDDEADNIFLAPINRFATITEDAPVLHPLWNELGAAT